MTPMPGPIPDVGCPCELKGGCICPPEERFLRTGGPLTDAQRQWCRDEIQSVEGYSQADVDGADDPQLCRTVLRAWTDFCRDKGLL